ncbi:MAG TPA: hypothetical protein VGS20_04890 [Candidatus Acidoferrales bacterium]|nr:hypothetical protein [Candidatus Acidoferrales bacterium]
MRRTTMAVLGLLVALAGSVLQTSATPQKDELKKLKNEIGLLESVLNQSIAQTFSAPFGMLDAARGVYLPGYGAVLDFELNLSSSPPMGSFAPLLTPEKQRAEREQEMKRREQVKELAEKVLADFGQTLSDVPARESVAIVIHTVAVRDQGLERSVMVVQAPKEAIDEYHSNAIDRAAFLRKLSVMEY